jgi:hypothetical protein
MTFLQFILEAIKRRGISAFEFERLTGDRFRNVKQGQQKPPLASLHKWAEVLELSDSERLTMLTLANEAHGGGTIAGWISDEVRSLRAQAAERDQLIAELSMELHRLKKELGKS